VVPCVGVLKNNLAMLKKDFPKKVCSIRKRKLCFKPHTVETARQYDIKPLWIPPKAVTFKPKLERIYYVCGFSVFFGKRRRCTDLYHYGSMVKIGESVTCNEVDYDVVFLTKEQIIRGIQNVNIVQVDDSSLPTDPGFVYNTI
jgi:hypothetical protein